MALKRKKKPGKPTQSESVSDGIQKRTRKDGSFWFRISIYKAETKQIKWYPQAETRHLRTLEEAIEYRKLRMAEAQTYTFLLRKKLDWRNKFVDFDKLVQEFYVPERKEAAPQSWRNSVHYVEQYVMPFFLGVKQSNNLESWHLFYEEFYEHLKTATASKGKREIKYNTKNHAIVALNTFMGCMFRKGKVSALHKCRLFPDHLMNRRGLKDIYSDEEYLEVGKRLKEINEDHYEFFELLKNTGMRVNEARGIALDDFFRGIPKDKKFEYIIKEFPGEVLGYLFIVDQPSAMRVNAIRDNNGCIARTALKHQNKMPLERRGRLIPITNVLFSILARRRNTARAQLKDKIYGLDPTNYLLFDTLVLTNFEKNLEKACILSGTKYKSPHCLRHTYATNLSGECQGGRIVKLVLGHKKDETTEKYVHLFALLKRGIEMDAAIELDEDWDTEI
jgi:integrase